MLTIRVQPPSPQPTSTHEVTSGPFDVGRIDASDEVPRCVVTSDPSVSRNHARITEDPSGLVKITNTSQRVPIGSEAGPIPPGESRLLPMPTVFTIGNTTVTVDRPMDDDGDVLHTMASLGSSPLLQPRPGRLTAVAPKGQDLSQVVSQVAGWFETLLSVQQAPAGSEQFYAQTARALVEQIGMNVGLVLSKQPGGWKATARHAERAVGMGAGVSGREFSTTVLEHLAREKKTIYQTDDIPATESLAQVKALVASPVLLPSGEVAGALYGVRCLPQSGRIAISPLEAQMVQVLATAVGIGLARVAQEEEAARLRVQLHQQFNKRLASELEADLGKLDPQDRDITVMFADIRKFSLISERLGPKDTFQLVSEVMETMTETVKRHDGAVTDYVGDEIMAIWNAPADQPDHAALAVRCATSIASDLAGLSARWQARLGEPLKVGVGLNSGQARVGNTGSRSKPKYGALGHTINMGSRVQGATKVFQCGILMTGATRSKLPVNIPVRRMGQVKVVGINNPEDLYHPLANSPVVQPEVLSGHADALSRFEAGDVTGAAELIEKLLTIPAAGTDGPTQTLKIRVNFLLEKLKKKEKLDPKTDMLFILDSK